MASDADLVFLYECGDQMELSLVKSLLESQAIAFVAQGEHHSTMMNGHFSTIAVSPRVLVAARDYEQAKALLESRPKLDGSAETDRAGTLDDALCPVHERQALATCERCGTFLCEGCGTLGQPPLCEDCLELESRGLRPALTPGQKRLRGELALAGPLLFLVGLGLVLKFFVGC